MQGLRDETLSWSSVDPRSLPALLALLGDQQYRFVPVTPATHERVNHRAGNSVARRLEDVLGWSRPFGQGVLPGPILEQLDRAGMIRPCAAQDGSFLRRCLVRVSSMDATLFVHSAFPTTEQSAVFFGPDTYKFVDAIRAWIARRNRPLHRAVDICCGAGPGAIAIAQAFPEAEIFMADLNTQALVFAEANAEAAGCPGAKAVQSDLLGAVAGRFDLIVAHPPYLVDLRKRTYRHGGGMLGAELALSIVEASLDRLAPGGTLLLFTGVAIVDGLNPFLTSVAAVLRNTSFGWAFREVDPDVFGEELVHPPYDVADRIALVVLEVTRGD